MTLSDESVEEISLPSGWPIKKMKKELHQWEVLKSFEVIFEEETIAVDLVRLQVKSAPELNFFVTMASGQMLLKKIMLQEKLVWISGGVINHQKAQKLGDAIEQQLGYPLPLKESNNPFEYKGDIDITIIRFMLGDLPAEKAKAPYSPHMWYRIYLPYTTVVMVNMDMSDIGIGWSWTLDAPSNLNRNQFKLLTDLVDLYEKKKEDSP